MDIFERALVEKVGNEHGWEIVVRSDDDKVVLASARHRAHTSIVHPAGGTGWIISLPAGLIGQELSRTFPGAAQADGTFIALENDQLALLLRRAAELSKSLPNQAAINYSMRVRDELAQMDICTTEVERLVKQRIGQDTFRTALLDYWGDACAVTGIDLHVILRASHAKPWADCTTDEERLDVFNGFLLCANLDALFDRGLITFDSDGHLRCSSRITPEHRNILGIADKVHLRWLAPQHMHYLAWHHEHVFNI